MTSQNNLDIKGNLHKNPLAELVRETADAGLSGSFRVAHENQKAIVYFSSGRVVFAASNARRHRLFELLLRTGKISQKQLAEIPNFTGDIELGKNLEAKGLASKAEVAALFSEQIGEILKSAFLWTSGEWIFSPLTRLRETIEFDVDLAKLLCEYARNLAVAAIIQRFKDSPGSFGAKPSVSQKTDLLPREAFVLSRFEKTFLQVPEIKTISGLQENETLKILYTLWLGGFLFRQNWAAAFSERRISEILSAKISLKKDDSAAPKKPEAAPVQKTPAPSSSERDAKPDLPKGISPDEYLERTENAANFYEILNVAPDDDVSAIKQSYFALARQFHPDKFHQEKDSEFLKRIRDAFAQTAQAYETLKDADTRKVYDYKLGKNLVGQKPKEKSAASAPADSAEAAKQSFEQGFRLLTEGEYEEALPLLARAVQLAPGVARFHAYYGKALSFDESRRHKAEAELQAAIKLEPQNAVFRLVSAEFYIQFGLFRRAEGELQRLLATSPQHREARALLDSLPKK